MERYTLAGLTVEIDTERPEAPIRYQVDGWDWDESPFQTASLSYDRRNKKGAWGIVNDWLEAQ